MIAHKLVIITILTFACLPYGMSLDKKLLRAIYTRNLAQAQEACSNGANCKAQDKNGATILQVAVSRSKSKIIKFLLSKGANIDAKDNAGNTPLHLAAFSGNVKVVDLLLHRGANPTIKNGYRQDVLYQAKRAERDATSMEGPGFSSKSGAIKTLHILNSYLALLDNAKAKQSPELLYESIQSNYPAIVRIILKSKPVIDSKKGIEKAIDLNLPEVIAVLLQNGILDK